MIIKLKDGSEKEYSDGLSVYEIAKDISEGLARVACAAEVDGKVVDLRTILDHDCELSILTSKDKAGLAALRHTTSHIMAEAVQRLFPDAKVAIGPSIDTGFYYDFDHAPFSREDLDKIEKEMKKIIKEGRKFEKYTLPRDEAIAKEKANDEPYKVELIEDLPEDAIISFYNQGEFEDLCAGPHLMSTKPIKAFKLISSSGAYWRGDENRPMLSRIYGTAYGTKEELEEHLKKLEEAKEKDHNKLGREMEIFTTVDVIGQGLPLLMPNGVVMFQELSRWIEDLEDNEWGYIRTKTPYMAKSDLYKISGHWDHYKDGMFLLQDMNAMESLKKELGRELTEEEKDKNTLALRPMTCPFQYFVYKNKQHSYRELPLRYSETSTLFRNEQAGEMHGLTRVRQFTLAEGHLIIRPDQVHEELGNCIKLCQHIMKTLGLENEVTYRLSKWDPTNREKYLGDDEYWNSTQDTLRNILKELDIDFVEAEGEAAFYGPKVDIQAKNVYGKEDTMLTIQLDNAVADLFDMYYVDENGDKKRPYIIHRSSLGCYERTIAWLIEVYGGKFPTWLQPEQVRVLPISDKYIDYAYEVARKLKDKKVRVSVDDRSEKLGYKKRAARLEKTPYILVVGEKEQEEGTVSVWSRYLGDEDSRSVEQFVSEITEEIKNKTIRKVEIEPFDKQKSNK